jgi:hypothetical protein
MGNKGRGIGGHERAYQGATNTWLTPPHIIKSLGEFDLDPCASLDRPWDTAKRHYTEIEDGLVQRWEGRVYLNPPYGPNTAIWLRKMKAHNNGVVLIFARTETKMYFESIWDYCSGILFLAGRIKFCYPDGTPGGPAGGPSVLISYDPPGSTTNLDSLRHCGLGGKLISFR